MSNMPIVITISRQLGSGGAFLGQQLAEDLGILYLDRQIVREAGKKLHVLEKSLESRDEKRTSFWESVLQSYALHPSGIYMPPEINITSDRNLFKAESEIIQEVAKEHSAVIIGRGGFYLLRDHPQHFSIFLHAGPAFRQQRIEELYKLSAVEAKRLIEKNDQDRADYLKVLTGKNWLDAGNYHLCIDTGIIGFDQAKEIILSCVHSLFTWFKKGPTKS